MDTGNLIMLAVGGICALGMMTAMAIVAQRKSVD